MIQFKRGDTVEFNGQQGLIDRVTKYTVVLNLGNKLVRFDPLYANEALRLVAPIARLKRTDVQ